MFCGVPFSTLQAITQVWQPTHRSRSTVNPHRAIANSLLCESYPGSLAQCHLAGSKIYTGVRLLKMPRPDSSVKILQLSHPFHFMQDYIYEFPIQDTCHQDICCATSTQWSNVS